MAKIWHNPKSTTHTTLVIDGEHVFVGSADDVDELESSLHSGESPIPLLGEKAVSLSEVTLKSIDSDEASKQITMHYVRDGQSRMTMVDLPSLNERSDAMQALESATSLVKKTTQASKLSAAKGPFVALVAAGFFTSILAEAAAEIAAGEEVSTNGRRAGLKKLLAFILEMIGATGVYVVGGFCVVAAIIWLVRSIANPPVTTTLTPAA